MLVNVQNYAHEDPIANSSIEIETDYSQKYASTLGSSLLNCRN